MIGWLCGTAVAAGENRIILNVQGVGYELMATTSIVAAATGRGDTELAVFVHTHVSEDRLELYGFEDAECRDAFRTLIGLSGVGPRSGLQILSVLGYEELTRAIALEDVRALQRVPGIGKKMAARICLELAEKGLGSTILPAGKAKSAQKSRSPIRKDAIMALQALGFPQKDILTTIEVVIEKTGEPKTVEDLVALCLKELTTKN